MPEKREEVDFLQETIDRNAQEGYTEHMEFRSEAGFSLASTYLADEGVASFSSCIDNATQRRHIFLKPDSLSPQQMQELQKFTEVLVSTTRSRTGEALN